MADLLRPDDLHDYLNGNPSPELRRRVETWLRASPDHQEAFLKQLDSRERQHRWFDAQTETELTALWTRLDLLPAEETPQTPIRPLHTRRWWLAAASVAALLLLMFSFSSNLLYQEYRAG